MNYKFHLIVENDMCCACGGGIEGGDDGSDRGERQNCYNTENGATNAKGRDCSYYVTYPDMCGDYRDYSDYDFNPNEMCCVCNGGSLFDIGLFCKDSTNGATNWFGMGCRLYELRPYSLISAFTSLGFLVDP